MRRRVAEAMLVVESSALADVPVSSKKSHEFVNEVSRQTVGVNLETVKVTWGAELVTPYKFHTCLVGPFEVTASVREGETVIDATKRVYKELAKFAEEVREEKLKSYVPNIVK